MARRHVNTVGQLLRYIRDARIADKAAVVIQAYGKAGKHYDWTIAVVRGELVICADLSPRQRRRCPICGGSEFEPAVDNHDDTYSGCVRCAFLAGEAAMSR